MPASDNVAMESSNVENNETHDNNVSKQLSDDEGSVQTVKANTIDELHSLQKKKNTTPSGSQVDLSTLPDDNRQKQQLQSIRYLFGSSVAAARCCCCKGSKYICIVTLEVTIAFMCLTNVHVFVFSFLMINMVTSLDFIFIMQ